jgi:hypothetical protein
LLDRLVAVWRTRGLNGLVRFIASRMLSHRRDTIFEAKTGQSGDQIRWDGAGTIVCISRENRDRDLSPRLAEQLSRGEDAEYLDGLRGRDLLLAVVDDGGRILHHSYILFETRTKALLGESHDTPLFGHCVTRPEARGQHLYPMTLRYGLGVLAQRGHARAIINCDPSNQPSVRGIRRAGFRITREVSTWIIGSWLGLQTGIDIDGRRFRRAYLG